MSTAFENATYYNWNAKFGGMNVSEAQRPKELENNKLKSLFVESMLDDAAPKDPLADTQAMREWSGH